MNVNRVKRVFFIILFKDDGNGCLQACLSILIDTWGIWKIRGTNLPFLTPHTVYFCISNQNEESDWGWTGTFKTKNLLIITITSNRKGKRTSFAEWWRQQIQREMERRWKHLKNLYVPLLRRANCDNTPCVCQQSSFSFPLQHFLGMPWSSLHFTRWLPSTRRPNSCTVVWQRVICWLVL